MSTAHYCPRPRFLLPCLFPRISPAKSPAESDHYHVQFGPIPMKSGLIFFLGGLVLATMPLALAQTDALRLPKAVEAGSAFSIQTSGNGTAVLYIVGLGQVLQREVQLGETTLFAPGDLHNAGHYLAVLVGGSSTENGAFDVTPAHQPMVLSFLAKPSRLPVDLHDGISGAVYVFDAFQNLVSVPTQVSFQLSGVAGAVQMRTALTRNGVAWTKMNSAPKEGSTQFVARVGDAASTRVIQQVPGDPCRLRMSVRTVRREACRGDGASARL